MADLVILVAVGLLAAAVVAAFSCLGMMAFVATRRLDGALRRAEQRIAELEGSVARLATLPPPVVIREIVTESSAANDPRLTRPNPAITEQLRPAPTATPDQHQAAAFAADPEAPAPFPKAHSTEAPAAEAPVPSDPPPAAETPATAAPVAPQRPWDMWATALAAVALSALVAMIVGTRGVDFAAGAPSVVFAVFAGFVVVGQWMGTDPGPRTAEQFTLARGLVGAGFAGAIGISLVAYAWGRGLSGAETHWLLTALGLGLVCLSGRYGPWLAAAGLVAGFAAPAVTTAETGPAIGLFGLLFTLTAAAFAAARWFNQPLFSWLAAGAGLIWTFHWIGAGELTRTSSHIAAGYVCAVAALGCARAAQDSPAGTSVLNSAALGATLLTLACAGLLLGLLATPSGAAGGSAGLLVLTAGTLVLAAYRQNLTTAAGLALAAAVFGLILWNGGADELSPRAITLRIATLLGIVALGAWLMALRPGGRRFAALFAAFGPLGLLAALQLRFDDVGPPWLWPAAGFILAAGLGWLANRFSAQTPEGEQLDPVPFHLASALACALAAHLVDARLLGAAALTVAGAYLAYCHHRRPATVLANGAAVLLGLGALRLTFWFEPLSVDVVATPLINELWLVFGAAIGATLASAHWLRQDQTRTGWADLLDSETTVLVAALLSWQLRAVIGAGDLSTPYTSLVEAAGHTLIWLGVGLGLGELNRNRAAHLERTTQVMVGLALVHAIAVSGVWLNPWWGLAAGPVSGGVVSNTLLPAYLAPALGFLGVVVWGHLRDRPKLVPFGLAGAAVMSLLYLTLAVRHAAVGPGMTTAPLGAAEGWISTLLWAGVAAGLLGLRTRVPLPGLAMVSLLIGLAALVKAFLFDVGSTNSVLTLAAIVALGGCAYALIRVYQRYVFDRSGSPIVSDRPIDPNLIPPR